MNITPWLKKPSGKLITFILVYCLLALIFYWIIADDWSQTYVETDAVSMTLLLPENTVVEQQFTSRMDRLEHLTLTPHFNAGEQQGSIALSLHEGDTLLQQHSIDAANLVSDQANLITLPQAVTDTKGKTLTLKVDLQQSNIGLWAGDTMNAGKFDVAVTTEGLSVDGAAMNAILVFTTSGYNMLIGRQLYWPMAALLLGACVAVIVLTYRQRCQGKRNPIIILVQTCKQYQFLIKQLVSRDFNVKYKSSMLGVLWSFLNPLLTMLVYLIVFSTIFRSDIPHFPVYLMSGIVLFNYFSESTSLGLMAITGNSALITKVYMPKVIYPLSKVLSSAVNLCISFIPLLLVMLITGVPFHKSMLLLPLVVGFLLMFCLGMSLLLSTMNVFFRDTQFLWGVLLTMLNFLTPVFYPESIIPAVFQTVYHMNPMYQILFFMRSITIGGVSPTPLTYLYCLLSSGIPLVLGLWIFRKNQDKFVLYL